jgi:hypothetical protein
MPSRCSSSSMDFVSLIGYESPHMTRFCFPHMRNFAGRIDTRVLFVSKQGSKRKFFAQRLVAVLWKGHPFIQSRKVYNKTHMKMTCRIMWRARVKSCEVFGRLERTGVLADEAKRRSE